VPTYNSAYALRLCCCRGPFRIRFTAFIRPQSRTPPRGSATISRRPRATHDLIRGGAAATRAASFEREIADSSGVRPPRRNAFRAVPVYTSQNATTRPRPAPGCGVRVPPLPSAVPRRPALPRTPAPARAPARGPAPAQAATCVDVSRAAAPGYKSNATPAAAKKWIKRRRAVTLWEQTLHQPPMHTHMLSRLSC